jgi:hypothetical protein
MLDLKLEIGQGLDAASREIGIPTESLDQERSQGVVPARRIPAGENQHPANARCGCHASRLI